MTLGSRARRGGRRDEGGGRGGSLGRLRFFWCGVGSAGSVEGVGRGVFGPGLLFCSFLVGVDIARSRRLAGEAGEGRSGVARGGMAKGGTGRCGVA